MGYSPKLSLLCCLSCFQLDHWYTTSPRSSIFFYWTMMLRNQDLGVNCSLCHWVSLLTGFLVGRVRKCMCVHKPMHNRTAIFISLSLSLFILKKNQSILISLLLKYHHRLKVKVFNLKLKDHIKKLRRIFYYLINYMNYS